ncbi:MAG: UvrD-helicase domain-containing protein [Actinomycetales bacterium]|nr:UvrD-helicase domain-containing protein [Actinomycetales bacterium]
MTIAGESAGLQARAYDDTAAAMRRQADLAERMAANYRAAASSESRLARTLAPLRDDGFYLLEDRRWPGSTRAQVDFVVLGPSGVFLVDAKTWRDVTVLDRGGEQRILQGDDDVTDRFDKLADLAETTRAELAEHGLAAGEVHGLAAGEVHALAVFTNRSDLRATVHGVDIVGENLALREILGRGRRWGRGDVERLFPVVAGLFPPYDHSAGAVAVIVKPELEPAPIEGMPIEAEAIETDAVAEQPALISVDEIHDAMLQGVLAEPIEAWMAFLHPDQARLVRKSFTGPSRIRGAAGTGKTVVGLHRAAHLARQYDGTVLVTTYVRTLPDVLGSLLRRMAPEVVDRVEFRGVFDVAKRVLRERGVASKLDGAGAKLAWEKMWRERGSAVATIDDSERYWQEEVDSVIKGRGLTSFEAYADCARPGRRRRLSRAQRAEVWRLYEAYESELRRRDIWDFADQITAAVAALEATPASGYSAVVIDEAQDLSCQMIRMLQLIAGDGPDALTLIGDGQQSIYPGGYTLSELGINLAGRGAVTTVNYRNTVEIAEFAAALVAGDAFNDIEGGIATVDAADIVRRGAAPQLHRFTSRAEHDRALAATVRRAIESGTRAGDIGVLAATLNQASELIAALKSAGVPTVNLLEYTGQSVDAVRVGTIKRSKGLEFSKVLVGRVPGVLVGPGVESGGVDTAAAERRTLQRRELYVAMTRARDALWVGVV